MRAGDGDSYSSYDDLSNIADVLSEYEVESVERYCRYGVCCPGFMGHNYISLYWGDKNADAVRDITSKEIAELNALLGRVTA